MTIWYCQHFTVNIFCYKFWNLKKYNSAICGGEQKRNVAYGKKFIFDIVTGFENKRFFEKDGKTEWIISQLFESTHRSMGTA